MRRMPPTSREGGASADSSRRRCGVHRIGRTAMLAICSPMIVATRRCRRAAAEPPHCAGSTGRWVPSDSAKSLLETIFAADSVCAAAAAAAAAAGCEEPFPVRCLACWHQPCLLAATCCRQTRRAQLRPARDRRLPLQAASAASSPIACCHCCAGAHVSRAHLALRPPRSGSSVHVPVRSSRR